MNLAYMERYRRKKEMQRCFCTGIPYCVRGRKGATQSEERLQVCSHFDLAAFVMQVIPSDIVKTVVPYPI